MDKKDSISINKALQMFAKLNYITFEAVKKRYRKLLNLVRTPLYNNSEKLRLHKDELVFFFELLKEMEEPYLKRMTSTVESKILSKSFEEDIAEARAFKNRMDNVLLNMDNEEHKQHCSKIIELISREHLRKLTEDYMHKIKEAGKRVLELGLSYEESVHLMEDANKALDVWLETLNERYKRNK